MATKRAKFVHRVSGRDDPVVQFVVHNRSTAQPSKGPRGTHRKRPPTSRIVTFSVEGSLQPSTEDMTQLPIDESPQAADAPALDELEFELDDLTPTNETPEFVETRSSRKTANMHLASWLAESSQAYLTMLYDREAPPATTLCDDCHQEAQALYRCQSCHNSSQSCAACLVSAHRRIPTHRIECWDETTWTETSLGDIGYILCLGHRGATCTDNHASSEILIGDLNGFTTVNVKYCTHSGAPSKALQLLSIGLFPCSDIHPRSAFTITLLETYNVFLTLGRTSAHKFYSVLERLTKPGFPGDVKDRYRELMATHRKYLFLLNLQRSGCNFATHDHDDHPGDQALDCVACPRLGINFDWAEVPQNERRVLFFILSPVSSTHIVFLVCSPWFRRYISFDGNFRSVRKSKKVEEGDLCLSDDLGYFPAKVPYKEWTEQGAQEHPQRTEKPICDHHKAGNDTSVRWTGQDVTGVGALTCTSHSCFVPRGMVDFFKGERFIYADYAFASAVAYLTRRGPLTFGLTYDVWCHWIVNFYKRAKNLPLSIAVPRSFDLTGGIPKFHLPGHAQVCYVRYSLDHTQYVGRMEGEGPERVWAHLNQHSGSTSEQGPGVRTDTINNLAYEWNYEKMVRMVQHLNSKFKEAKKMYRRQKALHDDLASSLPRNKVIEWEATSLEPVRDGNGKWSSPLMDPVWTDGSFQSVIQSESENESNTARVPRKRPGATRWLSEGIELEHSMRRLQDEIKANKEPTPRKADALNKDRMNLSDRVAQHQKRRPQYMATLANQESDHPDCPVPVDGEPEHSELGLPSSFRQESIQISGLVSLASLELDLRRAMCDDALDSLRRLLGARAYALKYKDQHIRGEVATTRAQASLRAHSVKISKARWRYENSRAALICLGADATVLLRYQEIMDSDLKSLKSYIEDTSRGVGQGYASIPWIWMNHSGLNLDEWQINALRTEWFRSRERYKRWEEQLVLLKREMLMTIRTFRKREEIWDWKARVRCPTAGMQVYALKQSRFHRELAHRALQAFRPNIRDDIVSLRWAEEWLRNHVNDLDFVH